MKRQKKLFGVGAIVLVALLLGIGVVEARWVRLGNQDYIANLLQVCRSGFLISVAYTDRDVEPQLPNPPYVRTVAVASSQGRVGGFVNTPNPSTYIADGSVKIRVNRFAVRGLPTTMVNPDGTISTGFPSSTYMYGLNFVRWSPNFRPTDNQQISVLGLFGDSAIVFDTGRIRKCFPFDYYIQR